MLVGFLGAPCSGKTTTAARMFAELKDMGTPTEFVTEKARTYIAWKLLHCRRTNEQFGLTDQDQFQIAQAQYAAEQLMVEACGSETLVLSDSCVLNSLLYMTPEYRQTPEVQGLLTSALRKYDLLYICGLVTRPATTDVIRVHSDNEAQVLHEELQVLVEEYAATKDIVVLVGPTHHRSYQATTVALSRMATL